MDLEEIKRAMHTLECGDTTFLSVERLAALKIVHDHLAKLTNTQPEEASEPKPAQRMMRTTPIVTGSEFLDAISDVSFEDAMMILDEHMEALRVVIPREYDAVMNRLWKLK